MSARLHDRTLKLLTLARQNPHFGLRLLAELPPPARAEAIGHWCRMAPPETEPRLRPGLKKCSPPPLVADDGLGAQLRAFARSIGRVG
jgi:hypothetical protein